MQVEAKLNQAFMLDLLETWEFLGELDSPTSKNNIQNSCLE